MESRHERVLKDSGSRTEFETGAVRDLQEGKGRCDLLPLDVVERAFRDIRFENMEVAEQTHAANVFGSIHNFTQNGDPINLLKALCEFVRMDKSFGRWTNMLLEVSVHFEDGAKKYGENNWQKGIPVRCYINSGVRHFIKWLRGDDDEPHDRAFCWNMLCAIWTCMNKPELNDYAEVTE